MIDIYPAIDLIDGQSVRLKQGDYEKKSLMQRPAEEAIQFYSQFNQVKRIHIVDLMGAKQKEAKEMDFIGKLRSLTSLPIQLGGGLRDAKTIKAYETQGIDYFILGTKAILDILWLEEMTQLFPGKIIVGLDAKEDRIYINGWTEDSGVLLADYLQKIETYDLAGIIYTDIYKDGMGRGPNFEKTARLRQETRHPIIASGGVRDGADLKKLDELGIGAAIVGKAANTDAFWQSLEN